LIVETVKVKNATIRVHDDCYAERTEEKPDRRMLQDHPGGIITKRENRLKAGEGGQTYEKQKINHTANR